MGKVSLILAIKMNREWRLSLKVFSATQVPGGGCLASRTKITRQDGTTGHVGLVFILFRVLFPSVLRFRFR